MITTTHGEKDERDLARTVIFEDRPDEFVVAIEWRLTYSEKAAAHYDDCPFCKAPGLPVPEDGKVLIRRDAHVILKRIVPEVTGIAANIG